MTGEDRTQPRYFSAWREWSWTCPTCAWQGPGSALAHEDFDALFEIHCPQCDHKFAVIVPPGREETAAAAAAGNTEAQVMMAVFENGERVRSARDELRAAPWPDRDGTGLTFTFTTDPDAAHSLNPPWLALLCEGQEIYREPSGFEGWGAIVTLSERVLSRYPGQVAWIDPSEVGVALLGDSVSASGTIASFLAEHHVTPPTGHWAPPGDSGDRP